MLTYKEMDWEQKRRFRAILRTSFHGRYFKEDIEAFGKEVIGDDFQIISREGVPKPHNYQGEIFALLRLTEMPIQEVTKLLVVDFLGHKKDSSEYWVAKALAEKISEETKNPYHDAKHTCNYIAGIALAVKEGLSKRALYRLIVGGLIHDLGHDQIFGTFEKMLMGNVKERLERKALKMAGILEDNGKVYIAEDSIFQLLPPEEVLQISKNVLATEHSENAKEVHKEYSDICKKVRNKKRKDIPKDIWKKYQEIAERYMAVCLDMFEGRTFAGYDVTTGAVVQEELHGFDRCLDDGKIDQKEFKTQIKRLEKMLTLQDVAGFREHCGPYDEEGFCSIGEDKLGVGHEVRKIIKDVKKGILHSVFKSRCGSKKVTIFSVPQKIRDFSQKLLGKSPVQS